MARAEIRAPSNASDERRCLTIGLRVIYRLEFIPADLDDVAGLELTAVDFFVINHRASGKSTGRYSTVLNVTVRKYGSFNYTSVRQPNNLAAIEKPAVRTLTAGFLFLMQNLT